MSFIEAKNLVKKYNKTIALDNISFEMDEGQVFGIMGPNGAGKSTSILLLSTLLKPDSGEICLNNVSIVNNPNVFRSILGLVPQDIALYPNLSARDNLHFWGSIYGIKGQELKTRINEVIHLVGLEDKLDDKVNTLSGGMKRRLNIAAALIHRPKIIIMDEPTVGIDVQSRKYIISAIKELNSNGATIIYPSHYTEEVESLCHRVIILDKGRIAAGGDMEELKSQSGIRERILIETGRNQQENSVVETDVKLDFPEAELVFKDRLVEIATKDAGSKLYKLLSVFDKNNLEVINVDIIKPDLEEVYVRLIDGTRGG